MSAGPARTDGSAVLDADGTTVSGPRHPRAALIAAIAGFFVITLDAVIVNVALPSISGSFGGGISALQWVVDGYTLMFAALLLAAGSLTDRLGARTTFAGGLAMFTLASLACGLAPTLSTLVAARFVQGAGAALMMPSSMALVRHAFPDLSERGRAVALWAMGGAVASSCGPVAGGLLSVVSWRLIFLVNVPVAAATLAVLIRVEASPRHHVRFDLAGQIAGLLAMAGLIYGVIEGGAGGFARPDVLAALAIAVVSFVLFLILQARVTHPMLPLELFRSRGFTVTLGIGFAFMIGYYGTPFLFSLYLQDHRGLSALATGAIFLPMMVVGAALTPFSARIVERTGPRVPIVTGLVLMSVGSLILACIAASTPIWGLALLLMLVGIAGPLVAPPATAVLLSSVPAHRSGVAAGVYNTARQVGGGLAVAVFGALTAAGGGFEHGQRISLLIIAAVALITAAAAAAHVRDSHG